MFWGQPIASHLREWASASQICGSPLFKRTSKGVPLYRRRTTKFGMVINMYWEGRVLGPGLATLMHIAQMRISRGLPVIPEFVVELPQTDRASAFVVDCADISSHLV